jgi:hypothetical protein
METNEKIGSAENFATTIPGASSAFENFVANSVQMESSTMVASAENSQPKRGRGRPRGSKTKSGFGAQNQVVGQSENSIPNDNNNSSNGVEVPQTPPVDRETILRAVKSAFKVLDKVVCNRMKKLATLIAGDDKTFPDTVVSDVKLLDEEFELITESSTDVIIKHNLAGEYAQEIILGVALAGYGWRVVDTHNKLNELATTLVRDKK